MRRLLRDIARQETAGDTTTLEDYSILAKLRAEGSSFAARRPCVLR
jgi:hypothetical protein